MLKFYSLRKTSLICFTFKMRRVSSIIRKVLFINCRIKINVTRNYFPVSKEE